MFTGVKVFTATRSRDRETLGEQVTEWLSENEVTIVDKIVTQSSDSEFHCITISLFYTERQKPKTRTRTKAV